MLAAVAAAGVPALVYASSVGAYSPGPKDQPVDESWPTDGVASSFYSRHKVAVERNLDRFEDEHRWFGWYDSVKHWCSSGRPRPASAASFSGPLSP